jgi:hypothetical protein
LLSIVVRQIYTILAARHIMELNHPTLELLIGGGIGFISATIGALLQYRVSQRKKREDEDVLPGCMFLVMGTLGFIGVLMIVISFILTGSLTRALRPGVGVAAGFFSGFGLLVILWLLWSRARGR